VAITDLAAAGELGLLNCRARIPLCLRRRWRFIVKDSGAKEEDAGSSPMPAGIKRKLKEFRRRLPGTSVCR